MRLTQIHLIIGPALLAAACGGSGGAGEQAGTAREEFSAVVLEARAQEAEPVLKQAYTLQQAYHADHQRYASTFAELAEVGWENPPGLQFHQPPRIVRADADALCMVMEPTQASLWPQHVDQSGQVQRGPCP